MKATKFYPIVAHGAGSGNGLAPGSFVGVGHLKATFSNHPKKQKSYEQFSFVEVRHQC